MNVTEIADSIDESAERVAQKIKVMGMEIASLNARLAAANEQVVRAIELTLAKTVDLDRATIDKLTADLHGAMVAVENYRGRAVEAKTEAVANSIAAAQNRTIQGGYKKIAAAIESIGTAIDGRATGLSAPTDGKYQFSQLVSGIKFWLEVGGDTPNCIWQAPNNVPYRSGNLNEVCSDGEAIYGCNRSVQPETFWKSIDGTNWEAIEGEVYRTVELAEVPITDTSLAIPLPDFNFVPVQPVREDPSFKRRPQEYLLAPHPIECEYGTVDLDREGNVVWSDRKDPPFENGWAEEIFTISSQIFGCRQQETYVSPDSKPDWERIDRDVYFKARQTASLVVRLDLDRDPLEPIAS